MARIVVVAPGRGTYNRTELNYLQKFKDHPAYVRRQGLVAIANRLREASARPTVTELDSASGYRPALHLPGENASALIFTCSAADYAMISNEHEVVATLGNSMGWYTTLYTGGTLNFEDAFRVVDCMGWFQKDNTQGGQVIYPMVDELWRHDPEKEKLALEIAAAVAGRGKASWVDLSIRLGGLLVFAGVDQGVKALLKELPKVTLGGNTYPFQLARHSAFHTPLMMEASKNGLSQLADVRWQQPKVPMIDGRGFVWRAYQTVTDQLRDYTLVRQVLEPYMFTDAVRVALREYNPDHLVLLGPGRTLGGALAQIMIMEGWRGIRSKKDFQVAQNSNKPPLIAMDIPEQADHVI